MKHLLTADIAPDDTLCAVGHPANGIVAQKVDGKWYYLHDNMRVDVDDQRMFMVLWAPGFTTTIQLNNPPVGGLL